MTSSRLGGVRGPSAVRFSMVTPIRNDVRHDTGSALSSTRPSSAYLPARYSSAGETRTAVRREPARSSRDRTRPASGSRARSPPASSGCLRCVRRMREQVEKSHRHLEHGVHAPPRTRHSVRISPGSRPGWPGCGLRVEHAEVEPLPVLHRRAPVGVQHVPLVQQRTARSAPPTSALIPGPPRPPAAGCARSPAPRSGCRGCTLYWYSRSNTSRRSWSHAVLG